MILEGEIKVAKLHSFLSDFPAFLKNNFACIFFMKRPFPSSPGPLFQNEGRCSAFDMEIIFNLMQMKLIFTRKVVHLASF